MENERGKKDGLGGEGSRAGEKEGLGGKESVNAGGMSEEVGYEDRKRGGGAHVGMRLVVE